MSDHQAVDVQFELQIDVFHHDFRIYGNLFGFFVVGHVEVGRFDISVSVFDGHEVIVMEAYFDVVKFKSHSEHFGNHRVQRNAEVEKTGFFVDVADAEHGVEIDAVRESYCFFNRVKVENPIKERAGEPYGDGFSVQNNLNRRHFHVEVVGRRRCAFTSALFVVSKLFAENIFQYSAEIQTCQLHFCGFAEQASCVNVNHASGVVCAEKKHVASDSCHPKFHFGLQSVEVFEVDAYFHVKVKLQSFAVFGRNVEVKRKARQNACQQVADVEVSVFCADNELYAKTCIERDLRYVGGFAYNRFGHDAVFRIDGKADISDAEADLQGAQGYRDVYAEVTETFCVFPIDHNFGADVAEDFHKVQIHIRKQQLEEGFDEAGVNEHAETCAAQNHVNGKLHSDFFCGKLTRATVGCKSRTFAFIFSDTADDVNQRRSCIFDIENRASVVVIHIDVAVALVQIKTDINDSVAQSVIIENFERNVKVGQVDFSSLDHIYDIVDSERRADGDVKSVVAGFEAYDIQQIGKSVHAVRFHQIQNGFDERRRVVICVVQKRQVDIRVQRDGDFVLHYICNVGIVTRVAERQIHVVGRKSDFVTVDA